jgi:hypothetical protein
MDSEQGVHVVYCREYGHVARAYEAPKIPAAPSDLDIRLIVDQLHLTWNDNASDETSCVVQCKKTKPFSTTGWETIAILPANTRSYQYGGLGLGTLYFFGVCARNSFGNSLFSNVKTYNYRNLTIPELRLRYPNGGEDFTMGQEVTIIWGKSRTRTGRRRTI